MIINTIKKRQIAIWGIGTNFQKKKQFILDNLNPTVFIDKNKALWGETITTEATCCPPEEINKHDIDVVVITPENSYVINEICNQLNHRYEIYTLNEIWDEYEMELQKSTVFGVEDNRIKHFSCEMGSCACNLNCSYCYVDFLDPKLKYNMQFSHSIPFILKALSRKRLGGRAYFNMCGEGETLLKPGYIELVYGLLEEGHYAGIITNGTVTKQLEELLKFPKNFKDRILLQFSLHYLELKQKNKLEVYFDNVNMMRSGGVSICTTIPGADEYIPYKDEIKQICLDKTGYLPVVSSIRTTEKENEGFPLGSKLKWGQYCALWNDFSSRSIEMRNGTLGKITQKCYAGISSGWINFETGELRSCCPGKYLDNIYADIKQKIRFCENAHCCEYGYCSNNGIFLSGRMNDSIQLPTWYGMFSRTDQNGDSTFSKEMREATDYCCEY